MDSASSTARESYSDVHDSYVPKVAIYADASCLRNGSPNSSAGSGAVLIDLNKGDIKLRSIYLGQLTNQQAEIAACSNALKTLGRPCRVEIFSDSLYVVETMMGKNRMKTNHSFWSDLVTSCFRHHLTWSWIRGHSGIVFQEIADRLSRAAAIVESDLSEYDLEQLSSILSIESDKAAIGHIEDRIGSMIPSYLERAMAVDDSLRDSFPGAASVELPSAFHA